MKTQTNYFLIFILFWALGSIAGLTIDSVSGVIFNSPFEWHKTTNLPEKPTSISKIFLDNVYIIGESGAVFRCALMSEECWSLDQSLKIPDFASSYGYSQEKFDACNFSEIFFSTKSFRRGSVQQCGTSGPWLYGEDLTITTFVVIDDSKNIWIYFKEEATFIDPIDYFIPSRSQIIIGLMSVGGGLGLSIILAIHTRRNHTSRN